MKIELKTIRLSDLANGYVNDDENGAFSFNGNLNIRPAYQREFVYGEKERNAVISSINRNYPLNVMYWVELSDGNYEVLDGQQRTISICEYFAGNFSVNNIAYHNLPIDKKSQFDNYEIMVYFCSGTESEKLEWFRVINIAGNKLKEQELRNAIYTGTWLNDAKKYFSKRNCPAVQIANKYISGDANRQDYLEKALKWISNDNIEEYMSKHQTDKDAVELTKYFKRVIHWVEEVFIAYRRDMKGIEWGLLYNRYKDKEFNSNDVEKTVSALIEDDEFDNKKGIYEFILSGEEKYLNLRTFHPKEKAQAFERQIVEGTGKATCPRCDSSKLYGLNEMEADHIVPWSKGGKTVLDNCQMLCKYHNGSKSNN